MSSCVPELKPMDGDTVLYKARYSGFYGTSLDEVLREGGIQQLIVVGATTSVCVESTVRDAMFRDYHCLVVADTTAEPSQRTPCGPITKRRCSLWSCCSRA